MEILTHIRVSGRERVILKQILIGQKLKAIRQHVLDEMTDLGAYGHCTFCESVKFANINLFIYLFQNSSGMHHEGLQAVLQNYTTIIITIYT